MDNHMRLKRSARSGDIAEPVFFNGPYGLAGAQASQRQLLFCMAIIAPLRRPIQRANQRQLGPCENSSPELAHIFNTNTKIISGSPSLRQRASSATLRRAPGSVSQTSPLVHRNHCPRWRYTYRQKHCVLADLNVVRYSRHA
jgi:hypothetical protein